MRFRKYQHVERFGVQEVEHIELGVCYIFPKIDGTNSSVWLGEDNKIHAGSRNREVSEESDNAGFFNYISQKSNIKEFLLDHPDLRLYGEWLVPHSLKTYKDTAWRQFYVFDVVRDIDDNTIEYLPYPEYKILMDEYNIDYIPPISIIDTPTYDDFISLLDKNNFLIKDGMGSGEGIVIKRYDYVNKYGRTTWAKIVTSEFKEKHSKVMCGGNEISKGSSMVEEKIVEKYITKALCDKCKDKIEEEVEWTSKLIPRLLNSIYYELINEDCWHFIKENKNPTINFKTLQTLVFNKVKQLMTNIF